MNKKDYLFLVIIGIFSILIGIFETNKSLNVFLWFSTIEALRLAVIMFWETWWALVLGFTIAGVVESWVSRKKITDYLEGEGLKEIGIGAFFGFVSSSCSFSAIATAKNLFKKGASAAASLSAFMFASTNLVIEIGFVMWILLGWEFVLADFIGGSILIFIMAAIFKYVVPEIDIEEARRYVINKEGLVETDPVCGMDVDAEETDYIEKFDGKRYYFCSKHCMESFDPTKVENRSIKNKATSLKGWKSVADKQIKEWAMLYEDIIIGFILAGIIGAFVPNRFWIMIFQGAILNVPFYILILSAVGVIIGILTFVCSVGNVPFAAILWNNGLPFGSVLSFIYADLIIPPIMDAYRKYYGAKFALVLIGTIFFSATVTGFLIHHIFDFGTLIPGTAKEIIGKKIELDYKAILNVVFTLVFLILYYLHKK